MGLPNWKRILIHHSATPDSIEKNTDDYRRFHLSAGWRDIGYHFVVEEIAGEPEVLMGRPLYMVGSHCPGQNTEAIGVCFAGNFEKSSPSNRLIDKGAELLTGLCYSLKIPLREVYSHSTYRETACPGRLFSLQDLKKRMIEMCPTPLEIRFVGGIDFSDVPIPTPENWKECDSCGHDIDDHVRAGGCRGWSTLPPDKDDDGSTPRIVGCPCPGFQKAGQMKVQS